MSDEADSLDGSVLPQNEIDALFKQATGKAIVPAATAAEPVVTSGTSEPAASPVTPGTRSPQSRAAAPPRATPERPPSPAPDNGILKAIQASIADLAQRMSKVEINISQLSQKNTETPDVSTSVQQISRRVEAIMRDLQKTNTQVRGIMSGLEGTPDYNARRSFTCESCGHSGFVAIPMRCTRCGSEGWCGWWPKEK